MNSNLSQILFVSAGAVLAIALIYIGFFSTIPSAGEYWGLSPDKPPKIAAEKAYAIGDLRFLGVRVLHGEVAEAELVYGIFNCVSHPLGEGWESYTRVAEVEGMDAWSEATLIRKFAETYNLRLRELLEENTNAKCSGFDVG